MTPKRLPLKLQLALLRHPRPAHTWPKRRRFTTLKLKRSLGQSIIPRRYHPSTVRHYFVDRPRMVIPFTGDPVEDMEIAKGLIAKHPHVDFASLIAIAADRRQPLSARIAAIYTLGFTDDDGVRYTMLSRILDTSDEPAEVRDHAAEALGTSFAEQQ